MKAKRQAKQTSNRSSILTWPIYIAIIIVFILYLIFQGSSVFSIIFGALLFFLIVIALILEFTIGVKEEGYKKNLMEVAIAIIIVVVIWAALRLALNTPYPLDVVPSCSMLPVLHRGDMILLQGVSPAGLKAPIINVNPQAMQNNLTNIQNLALTCVSYNTSGQTIYFSQYVKPGYKIGLFKGNNGYGIIVPANAQQGIVRYTCGAVNVLLQNGSIVQEASTTAITVGNTTVTGDKNNSIIVYQTNPNSLFYNEGDSYIVHRVYAILNASGSYYMLTKGDNNPGLDIQFHAAGYYNYPVNQSSAEGKVVADVPYLGYIKLILSNAFAQPLGCNSTIEN